MMIKERDLKNGLSRDTKHIINLITFYNDTTPVGSTQYKFNRYPGDIDIFEKIDICCSYNELAVKFINFLKNIIKTINSNSLDIPPIFWGEFKAGLDKELIPTENQDKLSYIFKNKQYFSFQEIDDIINSDDWKKYVRNFYIIRWKSQNIMDGYVNLKSRKKLYLKDALKHDTIVKLDLWGTINNKYNEYTNFFILSYNENNNKNIINKSYTDKNIIDSLNEDISLYSSVDNWKPLKLAKRMISKSINKNDLYTVNKLKPLLSSGLASLSQIEGELEVLILILENNNLEKIPIINFRDQIVNFKRRINDISDIKFTEENWCDNNNCDIDIFFKKIDIIDNILKEKNFNVKNVINKLKELEKLIHNIIDIYTTKWLYKRGIYKGGYKSGYNNYLYIIIILMIIIFIL